MLKTFHCVILCSSMFAASLNAFATPTKKTGKSAGKATASATASPTPAATINPVWDFAIKSDDSVFAIVTQKAGVAAKLAHNHFIAARSFDAKLSADSSNLNKGSFEFKTKVNDLEVDRADLQKRWYPTVQALGWLKEPFESLKDSDRETIRENMLASDQLNSEKFPDISAKIEKITDDASKIGERNYGKKATVALTIRGKTVTRDFAANINLQGQELQVDAAGALKFTDFGISPYKALLGALGNDDRFYMLVSFRALKK